VDSAASLELRGYARERSTVRRRVRSRHDRRLWLAGLLLICAALIGKQAGADGFSAYPALEVSASASTVALSAVVLCSGLVPWRRRATTGPRVREAVARA
jgi:hypothetical protein